ncbi:hypothetical protein [Paraburkholderia humisilvae]|uniref:hypothetical protein n=1 Tax=Paraburkholderia humisilvae TaxID=627669 RepID=UPI001582A088|nr:hypothetical protein [Paraburkholderia humisilvae]
MKFASSSRVLSAHAPKAAPSLMPCSLTTNDYRALDAKHHLHPFSNMETINRIGSRVIVRSNGVNASAADMTKGKNTPVSTRSSGKRQGQRPTRLRR